MQISTNYNGIDFKPRMMEVRWQGCIDLLKKKPETLMEIRTLIVGTETMHQTDSDDPDAMRECHTDSDPE